MSSEHPSFTKPEDENVAIWRYLTFTKFVSLIASKTLHFSSLEQLRNEDPLEGTLPKGGYDQGIRGFVRNPDPYITSDEANAALALFSQLEEAANRNFSFMSCWHINPDESAAMWKLYLPSGEGVAVRSTYHCLEKSIRDSSGTANTSFDSIPAITTDGTPVGVFMGQVKYIDTIRDTIPPGNVFHRILHKDIAFEYEHELRAVASLLTTDAHFEREIPGISICVDLATLIDAIVLPPLCPHWIADLTESLMQKFDVPKPLVKSKLSIQLR